MEPLAGKPIHHLQKLRTVHLDWLRKCPIQSVDPDHYGPDGACTCTDKRTSMTRGGLLAAKRAKSDNLPPKVIISTIMRPPPGRTRVRH